jgi:hypothetical protein
MARKKIKAKITDTKKKASKPKQTKPETDETKPDLPPSKETEADMRARIEAEVRAENEKPYEIAIEANKLKDGTIKVRVGPGEGARILQGKVTKKGEDKWVDLCLVSPPGAPNISISPKKKVKELRLMLNNVELEKTKV